MTDNLPANSPALWRGSLLEMENDLRVSRDFMRIALIFGSNCELRGLSIEEGAALTTAAESGLAAIDRLKELWEAALDEIRVKS